MATTIELTPKEAQELKSKGMLARQATDVRTNRRCYWDPHLDEKGKVMGWTRPLPGDSLRMTFYLRHGFMLQDPDGNTAPPPGYFLRRTPPTPTPREVTPEVGKESQGLQCPICGRSFLDADTLVHHMTYHRSAKAKAKARKPKRGRALIARRNNEANNLTKEAK